MDTLGVGHFVKDKRDNLRSGQFQAVFIHTREMKIEADSGYKINVEIQ